jgi:hypothetical protein
LVDHGLGEALGDPADGGSPAGVGQADGWGGWVVEEDEGAVSAEEHQGDIVEVGAEGVGGGGIICGVWLSGIGVGGDDVDVVAMDLAEDDEAVGVEVEGLAEAAAVLFGDFRFAWREVEAFAARLPMEGEGVGEAWVVGQGVELHQFQVISCYFSHGVILPSSVVVGDWRFGMIFWRRL